VQPTLSTPYRYALKFELHNCLARVESFLVRAGGALGVSHVEVSALVEPDGNSADIEEGLYGGFSFSPMTTVAWSSE
jgi:hypothetical protein